MNYALIKMAVIVLAIFAFIYGIINVKTHLKKTLENPEKMDMKKFKRHYYLSFILTFIDSTDQYLKQYKNNSNTFKVALLLGI